MNHLQTQILHLLGILMMQNKIIEFVKKNYVFINITILIFIIYIILFPLISIPLNQIIPQLSVCPYLKLTGKPCPLCGGTRYIANLSNVFSDITYLFHPFGVIVIILLCDMLFRGLNIITYKKEKSLKYIDKDISIHLLLLNIFNTYEIVFIIKQLLEI